MNGRRQTPKSRLDDSSRVYAGVDSCHHVVAHDHSQLSPAAVNLLSFDERFYVGFVMAQVRAYGSCSEVASLADDAVSDVGEVPDLAVAHDGAVFNLDCISHPDFISEAGRWPDVAVGADVAVFADQNWSLDVGS